MADALTPDLSSIKVETSNLQPSNIRYTIPITQQLPLSDGSGNMATVVVQMITVTEQQLTQQIAMENQRIAQAQAQVAQLQAQLLAIQNLAAKPVV